MPFALFLPLGVHFFETFPNGWDPTEYVWCVKAGYLPHSPYVLFIFLGRLLYLALPATLPAALALSLLSLLGGLVALAALARIVRLTAPGEAESRSAAWRGALAACLLAGSTVFVRQATTQEAYALQLGLVATAAWAAASGRRHRLVWGGVVFGCALAVHNASLFLLPAFAWLVGSRIGRMGSSGRSLVIWGASAAGTLGAAYAVVAWLLPAEPGARFAELLVYLRGLPPGLDGTLLADPGHLVGSVAELFSRLTDSSIQLGRGPQATGPVGVSAGTLLLAAVGGVLLWRRNRAAAGFWALWCGPFVLYEVALGWNLDYGIYAVFVMPPLCVWAAEALAFPLRRASRWAPVAVAAGMTFLLAIPIAQLAGQWREVDADRRRHDSATTLAARWASESLPAEAVVIQPRSEWNANRIPLYAERLPIARSGEGLRILRDRGSWTPMRPDAYELLTTEKFEELLRNGRPVYAFGPNPLEEAGAIDVRRFVWEPLSPIDLGALAKRLEAFEPERFAGKFLTMHRARRR